MPDRLNRHDLTDEEWERLRVFLPSGSRQRGGRRADHRTVINGIFFRTRAGCPWRDLPGSLLKTPRDPDANHPGVLLASLSIPLTERPGHAAG